MSSAWNVVRASNYDSMPGSENCDAADSPVPDKFKQKFTVNSLRMSIRKRIPLKRINVNGTTPDYYNNEVKKQHVEVSKKQESSTRNDKANKTRGIKVEASVKKTFYRVTEQFTGNTRKQLKDTPQVSTPRTRYRERLMSPPDTPGSPINPFDSPRSSTPLNQAKSLRRRVRSPTHGKAIKRTKQTKGSNSDEFSHHLEMISCGIQHLETNSKNLVNAIGHVSTDYQSSPLQRKARSGRNKKDSVKRYDPVSPVLPSRPSQNNARASSSQQPSSLARGMLRRTMTRMSLRVKNRPSLRSTKSASNIEPTCYNGPMTYGPRKLAPLGQCPVTKKR